MDSPVDATALDEDAPRFVLTSTCAMTKSAEAPLRRVVPGFVGEGLSVLAGRQKIGKSWLALNWAIAVACGGLATGSLGCEVGDVLYVDLHNGPRRILSRLDALFRATGLRSELGRLQWTYKAPPLSDGFIEALEAWRMSVPKPRFVVIDAGNPGEGDRYCRALTNLQAWATAHGIAVMMIVRTRAVGKGDPLERTEEAGRISACADTTLLLERDGGGFTLQVRGRDLEERRIALGFQGGVWTVLGESQEVRYSHRRQQILEMLSTGTCELGAADVAGEFDLPVDNVRRMLARMAEAGEIERCGRGRYRYKRAGRTGSGDVDAEDEMDAERLMQKLLGPLETVSDASEMSDSAEIS